MKKIIAIALLLALSPCFAAELTDLNNVKEPAYRVGTTDEIESRVESVNKVDVESAKVNNGSLNLESLTYADLSIKKISNEISQDLQMDNEIMLSDLSLLWQGAATKSDTIKFALYKLSNPEADKPDDKSIKKVLTTIASMSSLVGAGMGNPMLASGAFVGGNVLGIMGQDDKALNYKYSKVNDADMIILVRKIDELQQNVVDAYYDYLTARKTLQITTKMVKQRKENYDFAQMGNRELVLITDAYYRESLDRQTKARNEFYSKRSSLQELVGKETFKQFEENVDNRED